jgi:hypothetical protein
MVVEAMEVVLTCRRIERPDAALLTLEHDALGTIVGDLVLPDVEVAEPRLAAATSLLEPVVLVGGVVDDQVGDHPHPAISRDGHELGEITEGAEPRIDRVVVGDVVAVVPVDGRIERHQPDARDAESGEIVDVCGEASEVAHAVAVGVGERLDVEAVEHRVLPPQVGGCRNAHPCRGCPDRPPANPTPSDRAHQASPCPLFRRWRIDR